MFKKVTAILLFFLLILLGGSGALIYFQDSVIDSAQIELGDTTIKEIEETTEEETETKETFLPFNKWFTLENKGDERLAMIDEQLESGVYDFNALFSDFFFVGDSRTVAMVDYGYLSSDKTVSEIGARVDHLGWNMNSVVSCQPEKIIISYGVNDTVTYKEDAYQFVLNYESVIDELKTRLPDAEIYINSILPVSDSCRSVSNEHIDAYNKELKTFCRVNDYYYIDNEDIRKEAETYLSGDGLHYYSEFYPIWFFHMAEEIAKIENKQ